MRWLSSVAVAVILGLSFAEVVPGHQPSTEPFLGARDYGVGELDKASFINALVSNMTIEDLVLQMHLMFGGDIIGVESQNELYDFTMRFSPDSSIGVMHDLYTLNTTQANAIQHLNLEKSRLAIPLMRTGECLHGVGSYKQSIFPQALGLSASFDPDVVYRVGRAIGTEARSIGIHACLSPVLDLGLDARWGRMQEAWGEDKVLTSLMGVAYSSGLSKNASWSAPDAVVPVMKHFAAHGSPQAGHNAAPFMGHGNRQVVQEILMPFKAAVQLGGVKGVMMAYNELDDVPAHVHPLLYQALDDWGFDGFVMADDTGMSNLETQHFVADSPTEAIRQWFNAGGMLQFYDYSLETLLNATKELVANGSVQMKTLQSHAKRMLGVKWDLGLFQNPYIPSETDPTSIVASHQNLTLEAAQKSIVLLENNNATLPLRPAEQGINRIALIGPFIDSLNYGDYSGSWGQYPAGAAKTLRQGVLGYTKDGSEGERVEVVSSWGANNWEYNAQYVIPSYLLSSNGSAGGLLATYFADMNFSEPAVWRMEHPALDWGIYPPSGLSSNNFSAVWEGELESPVDLDVSGWIGVAIGPNTTVKLFVDDTMVMSSGEGIPLSTTGTIMSNIMQYDYIKENSTQPPDGAAPFTFQKGATYHLRIEYQAYNLHKKIENVASLNSQMILFWNLVSRSASPGPASALQQAVHLANTSDLIILAVGANWNSDGESGDRGTLGLAPSQDALARAVYALDKPVVLVLQGGRPFGINYYNRSAAVLNTFFPGQSGGQAIADVLFGRASPGGRMPVTVPQHVGQVPVYYHYKPFAHKKEYLDVESSPAYWFGYGLSYSTFAVSGFRVAPSDRFSVGDTLSFSVVVANNGSMAGSYVAQVYSLMRVSSIVQPVRQLVAFRRVYLKPGERATVVMDVDVDRYLTIVNRWGEWELEKGVYTFALLEHGGSVDSRVNVTVKCR